MLGYKCAKSHMEKRKMLHLTFVQKCLYAYINSHRLRLYITYSHIRTRIHICVDTQIQLITQTRIIIGFMMYIHPDLYMGVHDDVDIRVWLPKKSAYPSLPGGAPPLTAKGAECALLRCLGSCPAPTLGSASLTGTAETRHPIRRARRVSARSRLWAFWCPPSACELSNFRWQ